MKVSKFDDNLNKFKKLAFQENLSLEAALKPLTINPAKALNIYPEKGLIKEGMDPTCSF